MTGRGWALLSLHAFGAILFAAVGALALGRWGAPLGLLLFALIRALPYYNDRR